MGSQPPLQRVAFSPGEFAALFGKSQTWGYRRVYAGKVTAITEHGRMLIPAAEVERILGKAGTYNGLKPKVPKPGKRHGAWQRFIAVRREGDRKAVKTPAGKDPDAESKTYTRTGAFARLVKSSKQKQ